MLEMGERIRIDDLARKMIRMRGLRPEIDIPIVYTGVRPGEKLHEDLAFAEEDRQPTDHPLVHRLRTPTATSLNGDLRIAVEGLLVLSSHGNDRALIDEAMRLARGSNGHSVSPAGVLVAASAEHGAFPIG
jgi:O-antigen biosynthesis protein WbqV